MIKTVNMTSVIKCVEFYMKMLAGQKLQGEARFKFRLHFVLSFKIIVIQNKTCNIVHCLDYFIMLFLYF